MANWENLKSGVSRAANKTIKKAGELADTASLHFKLKALKGDQCEKLERLGWLTYKQLKTGRSHAEEIAEVIAQLDDIRDQIKSIKEKIEAAKADKETANEVGNEDFEAETAETESTDAEDEKTEE